MDRRLLLVVPALALVACGAGVVPAEDVAEEAEQQLEQQFGVRPSIDCPEDLIAEVGSDIRCTLTVEGDDREVGVTVRVTEVEGEDVGFDVRVDDRPEG